MASVPTAPAALPGGSPALAPPSHFLETGNGTATSASPDSIRQFYAENGYSFLPDALTPAEVEELRAETTAKHTAAGANNNDIPAAGGRFRPTSFFQYIRRLTVDSAQALTKR